MGYIVFFILILVIQQVVSILYYRRALKDVTVKRHFTKNRVFEGDELEVIYEIENRKGLPLINMLVIDQLPDNLKTISMKGFRNLNSFHISIMGYKRIVRRYRLKAMDRDYVSVSSVNLRIGDIFGIYSDEKEFKTYDNIFIYPKPEQVDLKVNDETIKDAKPVKRWTDEDPLAFYSIRKYNSTDSIRKINWNKTAQFNDIMVNEFETNKTNRLMLFVNLVASEFNFMGINAQYLESLIKYTAYISRFFINAGYEVSLFTNCGTKTDENKYIKVNPGTGQKQLGTIFDNLSLTDYHNTLNTDMIIRQNKRLMSSGKVLLLTIGGDYAQSMLRLFGKYGIDSAMLSLISGKEAKFIRPQDIKDPYEKAI